MKEFVKDVTILYFKDPSFIRKVKYSDIVDNLYKTKVSDIAIEDKYLKKILANVNIGLLEKGVNKAQKSTVFDSLEAAQHYQAQYGGSIGILGKSEEVLELIDEDDEDNEDGQVFKTTETDVGNKYYILNIIDRTDLQNGYRYIKELLLQIHNYKMYSDYNKLINAGIIVCSVKTDAFTVKKSDLKQAKKVIKFSTNIGGWRISEKDNIYLPGVDYTLVQNNLLKIDNPITFETVKLNDEWDVKEICNVFKDKKRVMVRGDTPGCGKSFACEHMKTLGHKVLFVCAWQESLNNYSLDGVTLHRFLVWISMMKIVVKSLIIQNMMLLCLTRSILLTFAWWQK